MSEESWARVSLSITSDLLTGREVADVLGVPSAAPSHRPWAADLTTDTAVPLADQLAEAESFLRGHGEAIAALGAVDIGLRISWTPRRPQDGMVLDTSLISALARRGCHVVIDSLTDD